MPGMGGAGGGMPDMMRCQREWEDAQHAGNARWPDGRIAEGITRSWRKAIGKEEINRFICQ